MNAVLSNESEMTTTMHELRAVVRVRCCSTHSRCQYISTIPHTALFEERAPPRLPHALLRPRAAHLLDWSRDEGEVDFERQLGGGVEAFLVVSDKQPAESQASAAARRAYHRQDIHLGGRGIAKVAQKL